MGVVRDKMWRSPALTFSQFLSIKEVTQIPLLQCKLVSLTYPSARFENSNIILPPAAFGPYELHVPVSPGFQVSVSNCSLSS